MKEDPELGLDAYRKKRDFERTPEPPPGPRIPKDGIAPGRYVVHRHEARNLHYDLRLEHDGALCSFAVPKGFNYDREAKHLAVRTEDHPIEYLEFHGRIPKGEYGAGTMTIWDTGAYTVTQATDLGDAMKKGELKLLFYGRRLRGEWHLVKTKAEKESWLLFKSRDRFEGPSRSSVLPVDLDGADAVPLPERVRRMEPDGESAPFSDPDWFFEMSFRGRRTLLELDGESAKFRGVRAKLGDVESAALELRCERALIDGVLVALDETGRPSEEALDHALAGRGEAPIQYYAFDLLFWEDFDLRAMPLAERKAALAAICPKHPLLHFTDHVRGNGEGLVETVRATGLPGVIAKRADAPYRGGASKEWLKIPIDHEVDGAGQVELAEALAKRRAEAPRIKVTNADKVFWPQEGYTKGDLVAYYDAVAELLVPHLFERPVHVRRFPDGIDGKAFYQRHMTDSVPDWIPTYDHTDDDGEERRYLVCNDRAALLALANLGSIDLHPWMSRRECLDSPDWMVLDLDPKDAPWSNVVRLAREAGKLLRGIGLRPLLKTSGATGLHVYVPLVPGYTYEMSRGFGELVARVLAREFREIATVERKVASRGGKVYLDFMQNALSQSVCAPYVPRPVHGATVSTPLHWDELDTDLTPARFTIANVPERIELEGDLFRGVLTDGQELLEAIGALEDALRNG